MSSIKRKTFLFFFLFLPISLFASNIDILIFSPHPDDATLCCGGTIAKACKLKKKVKVVFVTNGDAYSKAASFLVKKKEENLSSADYINLGKIRQKEAIRAGKDLGLRKNDMIFLSYPDKGLKSIWEETYEENYYSPFNGKTASPYILTYQRAKKGYNKKNLLLDIEEIIEKFHPKKIYTPSLLDIHPDHASTTKFVLLALDELRNKGKRWIDSIEIFYYCIHKPEGGLFLPNYEENVADFKKQKALALNRHLSQVSLNSKFFQSFIKDKEEFWTTEGITSERYLKCVEKEWENLGNIMHREGYNVNFAPVADVAENINCLDNPLVRKERIYSQNPYVVSRLIQSIVRGMNKAGIIAVVKHFPGIGAGKVNSHWRLSQISLSKKELYKRHLSPYRDLIRSGLDFWIMTAHTVYSEIDNKPASFSYKITTELLRKELGFEGIIITDELNVMQAVREYFSQKKGKVSPADAVLSAFKAGADFSLVYVVPRKTEKIVKEIIEKIEEAVKRGELKEKEIDISLKRILKEKEKIFHKPLRHYLKKMSLKEKIAQKIIIDVSTAEQIEIIKKYGIGGVHLRSSSLAGKIQNNIKIPLFIIALHEGGKVKEPGLHITTRGAYLTGKEYERLLIKEGRLKSFSGRWVPYSRNSNRPKLSKKLRYESLLYIEDTINELIELFSQDTKRISKNPSSLSPFTFYSYGIEIKPYRDCPFEWLKKFPRTDMAEYAYFFLKNIFNQSPPSLYLGTKESSCWKNFVISYLRVLRKKIKKEIRKNMPSLPRVLCLATHPDDEDGLALLYLRDKFNCQTYILLATRGEAGYNKILPIFDNDLGFLRMEEEEKAASILGVEKVYYLGAPDFGFTSSLKKVWKKWDRKKLLKKLVYFYRLIRPHIIITKHTPYDIHAQHRAFLILAKEAFKLAGNPKAYPEMIKEGFPPYKPLKFYERGEGKFAIDKKTYAQSVLKALKQHKTQGDWKWMEKFYNSPPRKISYKLVASNSNYSCNDFLCQEEIEKIKSEPNLNRDILPSGIMGIKIIPQHIGLIEKGDNTLFLALKILGYDVTRIDEEILKKGNLFQFDTIVIAGNSYHYFPSLSEANERLLSFVKSGGRLVIFAQSKDIALYAPYPLKIDFIPVEGDSKIHIISPNNSLFNFPNKIHPSDFDNWISQKGLFFPVEFSSQYIPLTAVRRGKRIIKGGLLLAYIGRGVYIITFYDWFRQLRHFNFGAYKILANMVAGEE